MWQTLTAILGETWRRFANQTVDVLPNVLASLLFLAVGIALAVVVGRLALWLLTTAQVDRGAARLGLGASLERLGVASVSHLLARLLKWLIIILAFVPALFSLDARLASDLLSRTLLYLPHLLIAVALLLVGALLSRFFGRSVLIAAVNHEIRAARLLAGATRVGIMLVATAVALEHLGIGRATVLVAFAILFGGLMLTASLALGLGSQDVVRRWLGQLLESEDNRRKENDGIRHW